MPTYEYVCESCGHGFEVFQSMKDPKLTDCPQSDCAGPVRRLLGTGAGLIFKGSGFYETDYRSASYQEGAKKEQSAGKAQPKESGTAAGSSSTSDSSAGSSAKNGGSNSTAKTSSASSGSGS